MELFDKGVEIARQLADFIVAGYIEPLGQVALALGNVLEHVRRADNGPGDAVDCFDGEIEGEAKSHDKATTEDYKGVQTFLLNFSRSGHEQTVFAGYQPAEIIDHLRYLRPETASINAVVALPGFFNHRIGNAMHFFPVRTIGKFGQQGLVGGG